MKPGSDKRKGLMMNCLSPNSDSELILLIAMRTFSEESFTLTCPIAALPMFFLGIIFLSLSRLIAWTNE